jgi:membrane protease YdiL (CAAX protease family)
MSEPALRFPEPAPTAQTPWISLIEVVLGAFIVIGHNVWHIVPNEVPILFILFWVSARIRSGKWDLTLLRPPTSWVRTIGIAVIAATVILVGSELVVQPLAAHIWHSPQQISSVIKSSSSNWKTALLNLAIVWSFAAFGEEIGYRGYLLSRAADLGGSTKLANLLAMIYVAVLFGFGHFYKGPEGILDSAYSGLVLGTVFLLTKRNLWAPILTHGIRDTVAVLAVFFGWAN